jgi:DNA-binding NarL/FixJ family response regulator
MKILLVDDHVLFREGVASILNGQPDLTVVGTAASVTQAIEVARKSEPDLVLMDFSLPDGPNGDAAQQILHVHPTCDVVLFTLHEDDERLSMAMRSGAKGYISKNVSVAKLLQNIRGLALGKQQSFAP